MTDNIELGSKHGLLIQLNQILLLDPCCEQSVSLHDNKNLSDSRSYGLKNKGQF